MRRETVHRLFGVSILVKGVDGVLEVIGGVLLALSPSTVTGAIAFWTAHELSQEPDNWIANAVQRSLQSFSSETQHFVTAYLVGHGLMKVFLVLGLWREKLWAFPTSLAFLAIFLVYQFYRFAHTHSMALLALAILDMVVMGFIWREYQFRKAGL